MRMLSAGLLCLPMAIAIGKKKTQTCQKGSSIAQKGKHSWMMLKLMLIKVRNRLQEGDGSVNQHNIRQGTGKAPLGSASV